MLFSGACFDDFKSSESGLLPLQMYHLSTPSLTSRVKNGIVTYYYNICTVKFQNAFVLWFELKRLGFTEFQQYCSSRFVLKKIKCKTRFVMKTMLFFSLHVKQGFSVNKYCTTRV